MHAEVRRPARSETVHALATGAWRFAIVSVCAYSVWAFGGHAISAAIGESGLYAAIALVFLGLAGFLMHPLMKGPGPIARFHATFVPAFLAYATVWCGAWYLFRFGAGEWIGSAAGSLAFVAVAAWRLGNARAVPAAALVLFLTHSAGYFAGGHVMYFLSGPHGAEFLGGIPRRQAATIGMLAWGLLYGLGFGAGIGHVFRVLQMPAEPPASRIS
jgi:hypothetical protein